MQRIYKQKRAKLSKHMAKAILKAEKELDQECELQTDLIYSAGTLALYRRFHWEPDKILDYFEAQEEVYDECGATVEKSMVQMCDEECELNLMRDTSDKDWSELIYLNPTFNTESLTGYQWLYMRQQQKKWVRPQILACFMLTAKRKYKFTFKQLTDLATEIQNILWDYEGNVDELKKQCYEEAGFELTDNPLERHYQKQKGESNDQEGTNTILQS